MSVDLRDNCVAQYKMNDNLANTTIINEYGSNGTYSGANTSARTVAGKINTALNFTGFTTTDFVNTNNNFLTTFKDSFSINFWCKLDNGRPQGGVFCGSEEAANTISISLINTGDIRCKYSPPGSTLQTTTTTGSFKGGQESWHMITMVLKDIDGSNVLLSTYFDGNAILQESGAGDVTAWTTLSDFWIGKDISGPPPSNNFYFLGDMDVFFIFNKAITLDEVSFLYNNGKGTEYLTDFENEKVDHNFFATVGDYDTRNITPDNATKLLYSPVDSDSILRTANNDFDHVMVSGVPLSASACSYNNSTTKFRQDDSRNFPDFNYFYALNVIVTNNVSHQTLTDTERTSQFSDTKLYVNRWNARNYLNTQETANSVPTDVTNLFGVTMALGQYGELFFNKSTYTINQVEEFKEVAFMNNLVSVGRIGNDYYLIITTE